MCKVLMCILDYTYKVYILEGMIKVNAITLRSKLGEVLEILDRDRQPVLIEKRHKIRAVLISYEDFKHRFIDKQAEDEKKFFLDQVKLNRVPSLVREDPTDTLRRIRGYDN